MVAAVRTARAVYGVREDEDDVDGCIGVLGKPQGRQNAMMGEYRAVVHRVARDVYLWVIAQHERLL